MLPIHTADYWWTRFLLRRGLGLVYLCAFLVTANQFRPLLGERGLLPVPEFLRRIRFRDSPSVFHLRYSDRLAAVLAWGGVVLSVAALSGLSGWGGVVPGVVVWLLLWALYLSFVNVGQVFYGYGWETLLLEAGFLTVFLGGRGATAPAVVIWLFRWVLFRVMFGAGLIKLRGDECWRRLTCLDYHYETQPLPNPLSWWLHWGPRWISRAGVAFTHFVQLVVPFGYFVPGPVSWAAGGLTLLFQGTLILSGNLSWLNWLTAVIALSCFDDGFWRGVLHLPAPAAVAGVAFVSGPAPLFRGAVWILLAVVVALSLRPLRNLLSRRQLMNASFEPLHLVNTYGAFGSVTRRRMEVVLEGTDAEVPDHRASWREYEFKGKPGSPARRPPVVAPYHLRLDWQMWFAAMSTWRRHPWILGLVRKLLEGDEAVLALLAGNPFPDGSPRHVRARLFHYRFTDRRERRETGLWWIRTPVATYLPPLSLGAGDILRASATGPDAP